MSASIPAWITGPRTVSVSLVSPNIVGICSKRLKNKIDLKCKKLHSAIKIMKVINCTVPEKIKIHGIASLSLIKTLRKTDLKYQDIPIYYTSGLLRTY